MIELKYKTTSTAFLKNLIPFQGESKKRSEKDIQDLCESLIKDGLLTPFAVWIQDERMYILDGHARYAALLKLAETDATILTREYPVLITEAATENEARKACLQMMSTYGKINKIGVTKFATPVLGYKAPVIAKISAIKPLKVTAKIDDNKVMIKMRVPKDKVRELIRLLSEVNGVEVCQ